MKILITITIAFLPFFLLAQIDSKDSTVQVVAYWELGEEYIYEVNYDTYQVENGDTSSLHLITYEVVVSVKDSTAENYLVEWQYKNFKKLC